jgi:hypothetical protein
MNTQWDCRRTLGRARKSWEEKRDVCKSRLSRGRESQSRERGSGLIVPNRTHP